MLLKFIHVYVIIRTIAVCLNLRKNDKGKPPIM